MGKVSVVATLKVKDGRADTLVAAFDAFFEHLPDEPGTEQYVLHRSTTDPNTFFVIERYTDQDAFNAHAGSEAFAAMGAAMGDCIADFKLEMAEPLKAYGTDR
ncbi:MAG TPA: antibiotic biosynthesis monooxygenase family protein [Acidimicrobiia bacterium]|nr:antibiotic biosynthesis monooxygenase family protein [Acidimicrobiia bacterium]